MTTLRVAAPAPPWRAPPHDDGTTKENGCGRCTARARGNSMWVRVISLWEIGEGNLTNTVK
jgi:hypothetical protein